MYAFFVCNFTLLIVIAIGAIIIFQAVSNLLRYATNEREKRKHTPETVQKAYNEDVVAMLKHLSHLTEQDWAAMDTQAKFSVWCDEHGYPRDFISKNHQSKHKIGE